MPRLVLDTNVVLDLLHWRDAAALPLLAAIADGRAACLADARTLDELDRVLGYPEFGIAEDARSALFARYAALAACVPPGAAPPLPRCRDMDDQKFLELAARGGAGLLVTKDKALLRLRGRTRLPFAIVAPAAALALLQP